MKKYRLWKMTAAKINVENLSWIASADYGQDYEKHLRALQAIHRTGDIPYPLSWEPQEALELTRWGEYQKEPETKLTVLFCALTLIGAFHQNDDYLSSVNQDLIIALDIVSEVGDDWLLAYKDLLDDLYATGDRKHYDEEFIFIPLARWLVSKMLKLDERECRKWEKNVDREVIHLLKSGYYDFSESVLNYTYFNLRHDIWNKFLFQYGWRNKHEYWSEKFLNS